MPEKALSAISPRKRYNLASWRIAPKPNRMSDVTQILSQIEQGDPAAAERLLPLVYDALRQLAAAKLANENPGHTLQPTALVHEAYLRLVDAEKVQNWNSRGHFFMAAAEAMRRILVENARRKQQVGRGGEHRRISIKDLQVATDAPSEELLALDESLGRLEGQDADAAKLVKLRYFAGMTMAQAADALGISLRTAERNWTYARSWLRRDLH
jgi:RNA polymerase sigma factor (TIGR02999 family)